VDDVEAFGAIRERRPDVPVLLMSGFNEQEATSQFMEEGIAGFLQNPFGIVETYRNYKGHFLRMDALARRSLSLALGLCFYRLRSRSLRRREEQQCQHLI